MALVGSGKAGAVDTYLLPKSLSYKRKPPATAPNVD